MQGGNLSHKGRDTVLKIAIKGSWIFGQERRNVSMRDRSNKFSNI